MWEPPGTSAISTAHYHFFSWGWSLSQLSSVLGWEAGYILKGLQIAELTQRDRQAFMLTFWPTANFESLINLKCLSLHCWRKWEYLQRTHINWGESWELAGEFESRTFLLWGISLWCYKVNHICTWLTLWAVFVCPSSSGTWGSYAATYLFLELPSSGQRSKMSFLKSAGAIGPVWGSHTQVLQLLQGPLLPLPSTSSVALLSVLGISQAFILMLLLSLDVPTSTTMTFFSLLVHH